MPPAISDDETDDTDVPDEIPARSRKPEQEEEEVEDDDQDEDEESYQVEKILSHSYDKKGNVLYQIKWLGYDDEKDQTWEPISNLDGAKAVLKEYHEQIGGAPVSLKQGGSAKKGKGVKRRSEAPEDSPAPGKKRSKNAANGKTDDLPLGSWEDHIKCIHAIVQDTEVDTKKKTNTLLKGLALWNNGRRTEHPMEVLRQRCPQKLLDYYEAHLVFRKDPKESA